MDRHHVFQHGVLRRIEGDKGGHAHFDDVLAGQTQLNVETGQGAGTRVLDLIAESLGHVEEELIEGCRVVQQVGALEKDHGAVVLLGCGGGLVVKGMEHDPYE